MGCAWMYAHFVSVLIGEKIEIINILFVNYGNGDSEEKDIGMTTFLVIRF